MSEKTKEQARITIEALKKRKHQKEYKEYLGRLAADDFKMERIDKALKKKRNLGKIKNYSSYE